MAGTVFPSFAIDIFSSSHLSAYIFKIDGKVVPSEKIKVTGNTEHYRLVYQSDFITSAVLQLGTHTAEISVTNQSGEKTSASWQFTVGIDNVPTEKIPSDAVMLKDLTVPIERLLPGTNTSDRLHIIIFQNASGQTFFKYRLTTSSGITITTNNLAHIGRELRSGTARSKEFVILPRIHRAFIGDVLDFSRTYTGNGEIINEKWSITSGESVSSASTVKVAGDTKVVCTLTVEYKTVTSSGEIHSYQEEVSTVRYISVIDVFNIIKSPVRDFHVTADLPVSFALTGYVHSEIPNLAEGKEYTLQFSESGEPHYGIFKVERLRWKITNSDGEPVVAVPTASHTSVVFTRHGFAEVVFDVKLAWEEDGKRFEHEFAPTNSLLFAVYPVVGKAEFEKMPALQIEGTKRRLNLKRFEFSIKDQKRIIEQASDWHLAEPIVLCRSTLWPASSPIIIENALPLVRSGHYPKGRLFSRDGIFSFLTLPELEPGIVPLSFYCQFQTVANPNASNVNESRASLVSDLPGLTVFTAEDLLELKITPSEKLTIPEGQQVEYTARIVPKTGFGSGEISAGQNNLIISEGYRVTDLSSLSWSEVLGSIEDDNGDEDEDWKVAKSDTVDFSHVFNPKDGFGDYTLYSIAVMNLVEEETGTEASPWLYTGVPVESVPGFRILSPIDKLAYPLNQTIKVTTTMDSEDHTEQWEKIQWKLNGEKFIPPGGQPAFPLLLNKIGKWKLEAVLTTIDPNTGKEIILKDDAEFEVKPLEASITPARKVLDFNSQKLQEVKISVFANGNEIKKPGEATPWQTTGTKIIVDSVAWKLSAVPDNAVEIDLNPQSFKTNCKFSQQLGAATALATITVRIIGAKELFDKKHKGFNDKFEEQIFDIPVGRADLWAVNIGSVSDINNSENSFPDKAIAGAYRTYELKSFSFVLNTFQKEHSYNNQTGWSEPIILQSALPGIDNIETNTVDYIWKAKAESGVLQPIQESPTKLVIKPSMPGKYNVDLEISLPFGNAGSLKVAEKNTAANSVNLSTLIEVSVEPASFTLTIGEPKTLRYLVKSIESQPAFNPRQASVDNTFSSKLGNVLYLLNNSYALWIDKVQWSDNQPSDPSPPPALTKETIESNPHIFQAQMLGIVKGLANGSLMVTELISSKKDRAVANYTFDASWSAFVRPITIKFFINGITLGSGNNYLGQKIVLSYEATNSSGDFIALREVEWSLEEPLIRRIQTDANYESQTIDYMKRPDFNKNEIEFFLYDYASDKTSKLASFTYAFNGKKYVENFTINYKRPAVSNVKFLKAQKIAVSTYAGDWTIGFPNQNLPGAYAFGDYINPTSTAYRLSYFQLIKRDNYRTFTAPNDITIQQYLKTIKSDASYTASAAYWLDTFPPWGNSVAPDGRLTIPPNESRSDKVIANDIPLYLLQSTLPLPENEIANAKDYSSISGFYVFVVAKPVEFSDLEGVWCPLKVFEWGWDGKTTYNAASGTWLDDEHNYEMHDLKEMPTFLPTWAGKAMTGSNIPNWRYVEQ